MKRLIISLELADKATWEQVQQAIAYNTPANVKVQVGDGAATYPISTHGVKGFVAVIEDTY